MKLKFESTVAKSARYRPDIDGLRALAVLPVVLFHANVPGFSGGFIGVDIFFVISGFLITRIVSDDIRAGNFSLAAFYERRIRRIFPALFSVVLFCAIVAAALLTPPDLVALAKSTLAVTFFASNFYFRIAGGADGYFQHSQFRVLLHTWSLAVEEQFYLVFPAVLLMLGRWRKSWTIRSIAAIAMTSFLLNVWMTWRRPQSAFYWPMPRAWELLIGGLLSLGMMPPITSRLWREVMAWAGLVMILVAIAALNGNTKFPGVSVLLPCAGSWLVIYAGDGAESSVATILSFPPLVFIGVISYSLYLWHWPLLVFGRYFAARDLTGGETAVVVMTALTLAFISFEFIESPFRGRSSRMKRRHIFAFGGLATTITAFLCFFAIWWHGVPERYSASTRRLVMENIDRKSDFDEECSNWRTEVSSMRDIHFCTIGPDSQHKIFFWGDSHVQQMIPMIRKFYGDGRFDNQSALIAIQNACVPDEHLNSVGEGFHCDSFAHFAMIRAQQDDIDSVFIGFNTWWTVYEDVCPSIDGRCTHRVSVAMAQNLVLRELADNIATLQAKGKRVILALPFPMYDHSIPDVEIRNAVFGRVGLNIEVRDITISSFRDRLLALAESMKASVFDPRAVLCDARTCMFEKNGVSLYIDDNHIAQSQIFALAPEFARSLSLTTPKSSIGQTVTSNLGMP